MPTAAIAKPTLPPARQRRSRETLNRVLAAAETLLQDRDFDQLTMAAIAEHAGCAVGTLYARVPSKERLLHALYERYGAHTRDGLARFVEATARSGLRRRVEQLCALLVEVLHKQRGVVRAITEHLFSRAGRTQDGFRAEMTAQFREIAAFLSECDEEIEHPQARQACEFALLAVFATAQHRVVFGDRSGIRVRWSRAALTQQLTTLMLSFLCQPSP